MATQLQFRNDTTANWTSANPILAKGELGVEFLVGGSVKTKIGDGVTYWNTLTYNTIGATGATGPTGATGTGLTRVTASTIVFATEDTYVEKTITDALITSSSIIIVILTDKEAIIQNMVGGVVSISNGVNYIIYVSAPYGATGTFNLNILIF